MSNFRQLPSVDALLRAVRAELDAELPHALLRDEVRAVLDEVRATLQSSAVPAPDAGELAAQVLHRLQRVLTPNLRPVINAGGVIIQTNLGRAPLSAQALQAMATIGAGYSNLEYDLLAGTRGSRNTHLEALLRRLSGAEAALAVNNNAAAIYLVLIALAAGREVIVSRGQAVEIGGGFRIPDVLRQSGATLVEVGTTNRTYPRDYAAAITERSALLMRVHTSNFRLQGFVHETGLADLVAVGRTHGVPVLDDLGSGTLLPTAPYGLFAEPTVPESVAAGADLVTFSGDKLLGGPQAGLIVGRAELVAQLRKHPLARALRLDKTTIAGLEATLQSYVRGRALAEIPIWRMISMPLEHVQARAERVAAAVGGTVIACESAVGGGSLPGETLPSCGVALAVDPARIDVVARQLRTGAQPVVPRVSADRLICDLRTVLPEQDAALCDAVLAAGGGRRL